MLNIRPLQIGDSKSIKSKSQIQEISFVIFMITSIALCFVFAAYIYGAIMPQINSPSIANINSITAYNKFQAAFPIFDNSMIFIVIGLTVGLLVTSFLIPTHPVFLIINIFGFMVLVFLSAVMSNTYFDIAAMNPSLTNVTQVYYPHTSYIMQYLPIICCAIVGLSTLILYAKGRSNQGAMG